MMQRIAIPSMARLSRICFVILHTVVLAAIASPVQAVQTPAAIDWSAAPLPFVTSLYWGVLGRAPESAAIVSAWATQIDGTYQSRLSVFMQIVASPEYRAKFGGGGTQGQYHLWQNYCPQYVTDRFRVAPIAPVTDRGHWIARANNVSLNYGLALAGYAQAAFPFQPCTTPVTPGIGTGAPPSAVPGAPSSPSVGPPPLVPPTGGGRTTTPFPRGPRGTDTTPLPRGPGLTQTPRGTVVPPVQQRPQTPAQRQCVAAAQSVTPQPTANYRTLGPPAATHSRYTYHRCVTQSEMAAWLRRNPAHRVEAQQTRACPNVKCPAGFSSVRAATGAVICVRCPTGRFSVQRNCCM